MIKYKLIIYTYIEFYTHEFVHEHIIMFEFSLFNICF